MGRDSPFQPTEGKVYQKGETKNIVSIMIHIVYKRVMPIPHTVQSGNDPFIFNRDCPMEPAAVPEFASSAILISN